MNIGVVKNVVCKLSAVEGTVGDLRLGLKAAASGLKDVARCRNTAMGRSMLSLLLRMTISNSGLQGLNYCFTYTLNSPHGPEIEEQPDLK